MSNQVVCPECGTENAYGSKFCNHCGTRLPPSTHIICPNCSAPNPRNRLYCDNCGTRLVEEHPLPEEETEEETYKPSSANLSFFSLPTRKPGDTSDLAPGLSEGIEPDELADLDSDSESALPNIEELTGEPGTADLPDWLVESNAEPIIKPPEAITTEHYFDLLKRSIEAETGEEATADDIKAAAANLPEWLAAAGIPTPAEEHSEPDNSGTVDIPDWISMPGDDKSDEPETEDKDEDDLQDWLAELGPPSTDILASPLKDQEEEADLEEDNLADWLAELGPPNTNILSQPGEADGVAQMPEEDSSDWLTELSPPDTGPLAESDAEKTVVRDEDWQADLPIDFLAEAAEEDEGEATIIGQTPFDEDESDWLAELDTPDTDTFADTGSGLEETLVSSAAALPDGDWLGDLSSEEKVEEEAEDESDWLATPPISDDLTVLGEADAEDTAVDLDKWFADDLPGDELEEEGDSLLARLDNFVKDEDDAAEAINTAEPSLPDDTAVAQDALAWLDDDEPAADAEPEPIDTAVPEELPDWLSDLGPSEGTDEFAALNQLAGGDDALPDWFDEQSNESDAGSGYSSEADLFLTGLLRDDKQDDTGLDWLTVEEKPETTGPAESGEETAAEIELPAEELEEPISDEDPAWLTSLFSTPPDEKSEIEEPAETAAAEEDLDALFVGDGLEDEGEDTAVTAEMPLPDIPDESEEVEAPVFAEEDDDTWFDTGLEETDQPLPDWIEQLGPAQTAETESETGLIPSDELPEWVADLRPELGSEAGSLLPRADEDDTLVTEIPDELVGAELPEWLQDVGIGSEEPDIPVEAGDATGWIESESGLAELLALDEEDMGSSSDWGRVLGELPPSAPVEERMAEADLPEWIEALKPRELTSEGVEPEPEPEPEESGPLVGVRGVVEIAPIISMPRPMNAPKKFAVSKEQQQQASLLKQISQAQPTPVQAPGKTAVKTSAVLRFVLILALVGSILAGLLGPDWLATRLPAPSPAVSQLQTAVQAAAGKPVLLAFEYTPALAGELSPQAELFVQMLADNGSQIVTISQAATGTALADIITDGQNRVEIGLLPGEAVGLRQLGSCLGKGCTSIFGRALDSDQQQALAGVELIILLTGDQDSLVNWVEQVSSVSDLPLAAGITQALQPAALPYFANGQIDGMTVGIADTAVYRQAYLDTPSDQLAGMLNAQGSAQMITAVLLLLGALIYSISTSRKKDKA